MYIHVYFYNLQEAICNKHVVQVLKIAHFIVSVQSSKRVGKEILQAHSLLNVKNVIKEELLPCLTSDVFDCFHMALEEEKKTHEQDKAIR